MTHSDIKIKFLIEYDKMTTTSSYPSLTDYEIATVLDKAYNAVIANKLTGNNPRRVAFEGDIKAIEDVRPLIVTKNIEKADFNGKNKMVYNLDTMNNDQDVHLMYYLQSCVNIKGNKVNTHLVSHQDAQRFEETDTNKPWVSIPVLYLENHFIYLLFDSFKYNYNDVNDLECTFIKKPKPFVLPGLQCDFEDTTYFELNDNVAQEVINMAIIMSAEIVESQRLSTKTSINSIES